MKRNVIYSSSFIPDTKKFLEILFICLMTVMGSAQSTSSPILFIYDASGSMWGQIERKTKMEIAAEVLSSTVNDLPEGQKIGLMAYGHRSKGDCDDVEMLADMENISKTNVIASVKAIKPLGKTPLARSATMAINALKKSGEKATIILITDGIESCDGNLCEVVRMAKAENIDFKLHIVGFGLKKDETEALICAARAGDGQYYDADDGTRLGEVLNEALVETVDEPAPNYSIYTTKNDQSIDSWVKAFKSGTEEVVDAGRTYRDSSFLYLPPGNYDINIQPLEGLDVSGITINVEIQKDETGHKTVRFDAAKVEVSVTNNGQGHDAIVKLLSKIDGKVAASARTYERSQVIEVNPGMYDITFQALKLSGLNVLASQENIEFYAGETYSLSHNFSSGKAMIGVNTANGELIDATINFFDINTGQSITAGRSYRSPGNNPKQFLLNPGNYQVKIVTLGKHKGQTKTFDITVKTNETIEKIITF
jgi:Ca-activated chloride channel family protein